MCKILISVLIFCLRYLRILNQFIILHHALNYEIAEAEISKPDFDVFVFTQNWPVSVCKWWLKMENGTACAFPDDKNRWTLHGIWPKKSGDDYVTNCNSSSEFDPEVLEPIKDELNQAWIEIYKDFPPSHFWKHEWEKHGTCALDVEAFNSQLKYFIKGIEWNLKYSLSDMLSAAKLFPDDTRKFTAKQFTDAVTAKTKKRPMIGCYSIDDTLYLHELRICLDKQLNLIDCETLYRVTCFPSKPVYYPASV